MIFKICTLVRRKEVAQLNVLYSLSLLSSSLDTYSQSVSSLVCNVLCRDINVLVIWPICLRSSLVHFEKVADYLLRELSWCYSINMQKLHSRKKDVQLLSETFCNLWVLVFMHLRNSQCWRVLFFLLLIHTVSLCHLSIISLSFSRFVWVPHLFIFKGSCRLSFKVGVCVGFIPSIRFLQ